MSKLVVTKKNYWDLIDKNGNFNFDGVEELHWKVYKDLPKIPSTIKKLIVYTPVHVISLTKGTELTIKTD